MYHEGFVAIGSFGGPHGYKGHVNAILRIKKNKQFTFPDPVYVVIQHTPVPFFQESCVPKGNKFTIKFKDVDTEEQARSFVNKELLVTAGTYETLMQDSGALMSLAGYAVSDEIAGDIGLVEDILEYPGQDILLIKGPANEEILVPVNDAFILKIDHKKQSVFIRAPEGLLELYMKK